MNPLERQLSRSKGGPVAYASALLLAAAVFVSMGLTQLNIEYSPPEPAAPIATYHLPPPPPPPEPEPPPERQDVSINFDLPITDGPADIALGFLDVDFGLDSKLLAQADVDVDQSIESFQTDGLDDLEVYDYKDVTEPPERRYTPSLKIPSSYIDNTREPIEFTVIYRATPEGRATDVRLIVCPYPKAAPIVTKFVEGIRTTPPIKDGRKVSCLVRFQFTYYPVSSASPFGI